MRTRHSLVLLGVLPLLLCLAPTSAGARGGPAGGRGGPPPGIAWQEDVEATLARAAREGRPVLLAVNALEGESANNALASTAYRASAWGAATAGYLCLVCNPGEHGGATCARYPGIPCTAHRDALAWFLRRFGPDLISPQHVILEPDGDVAFRKEYYTRVVGPALLEGWLSHLAPETAYAHAVIGREARMEALRAADPESTPALVRTWLGEQDGVAAAAIANVLDDEEDPSKRLALIRGLAATPALQAPVLALLAQERVFSRGDEPAETLAWVGTLFACDRTTGIWAATRVLVRAGGERMRDAVLRLWTGRPPEAPAPALADVPEAERAWAYEALLLVGDRRARASDAGADWVRVREAEVARALRVGGHVTAGGDPLAGALAGGHPRALRRALAAASPEAVRAHAQAVAALVRQAPWARVRAAAALALVRARHDPTGAGVEGVLAALSEPVEGEFVQEEALALLGEDPGPLPAEWRRLLESHVARDGEAGR